MIEIHRTIRAAPETIFAYFTDAQRYTEWMGVDAELDATPGGIYRVRVPQGYVAIGEFVEVQPPTRLVFTWGWEGDPEVPPGSSRVEVTLTEGDDGTELRLLHTGLPTPESYDLHELGWQRYLGRLVVAGEGGIPGPDEA